MSVTRAIPIDTAAKPPSRALLRSIKSYSNIIYALILHDIKSRFFGSGLGQIVMVAWPFVHICIMLAIYSFTNRPTPYGDSLVKYSSISIYPFIVFSYTSRWIVIAATTNKSFLQYPIIRPLDILIARAALECISITVVGILVIVMCMSLGIDMLPSDFIQAFAVFWATIFMSMGIGVLNGVLALAMPYWGMAYTIVIVVSYISSGVLFVASTLPEQVRVPLSYNPLLICVEWYRSAFYADYPTMLVDRSYVMIIGLTTMGIGFMLSRLLRRFI